MLAEGLSLRYQPIVDASSGRLVAVEALLRRSGERAAPLNVLKYAAERGIAERLDRAVISRACSQTNRWLAKGLAIPIHVNLSTETAMTAHGGRFAAWLTTLPNRERLLTLELTETTRVRSVGALVDFVDVCRGAGVEVAIDDFGCGYSTLALLQHVRADAVKIDRRFVRAIAGDAWTRSIVRHMIALAHDLGMRVIGEGVETARHADALRALGCDALQGYAIGVPMTSDEIESWIRLAGRYDEDARCANGG